jgi:holin-like protein
MTPVLKTMAATLASVAILAVFQWLGTLAMEMGDFPLPGPVAGLFLLFCLLLISGEPPRWFSESCARIISLLSLFFLPAGAGIFFLGDTFHQHWLAIILAILVATPVSIAISALIMSALFKQDQSCD